MMITDHAVFGANLAQHQSGVNASVNVKVLYKRLWRCEMRVRNWMLGLAGVLSVGAGLRAADAPYTKLAAGMSQ